MSDLVLQVRLTAITNDRHRIDMTRPDGSVTSTDLETRSTLFHDLVHFAVETEAGLADSFFGRVAKGQDPASLTQTGMNDQSTDELAMTERVIGPLQGWLQHRRGSAQDFVTTLGSYLQSLGQSCPRWLEATLIERVAEKVRHLQGHWQGTKHGETMQLTFTVPA